MPYLLEDLQKIYAYNMDVIEQIESEFGDDYYDYEEEFNEYWNDILMPQIIKESSKGDGKWAGAGPVDYNEAKVIYLFIRTKKPRNVLEIGFASGVSSSLIAKALEMNGEGNLYTGDLNSDPSHKWIISEFKKYIKNGIIKATYPIDGVQFVDQMDKKILNCMIDKFKGGPIGLSTIATAVSEEANTIEELYEPFLIKQGYLERTPRGRQVTNMGYMYLGKQSPDKQGTIF